MKNIAKGIVLVVLVPLPLLAEVTVDGSLGGGSQSLSGPKYDISENLGQRNGTNLFHSFSAFNINTGEEAQFSTNSTTSNIFARVTGGNSSLIDGKVSVHNSSANLWLMNPAGWIIGKNAQINVQGAFHVSTADAIGFDRGGVFFADPVSQSVLSVSEPIDYQFNQGAQATITLDQADLILTDKQDITLLGGDIKLQNASIQASGGRIILASNAGAGTWQINESGLSQSSGQGGVISIEHDADTPASLFNPSIGSSERPGSVESDGISSGGIQLTAEQILLKNAAITGQSWSDVDAGDTRLEATGISLTNSKINTEVSGSKNAGLMSIYAQDLSLDTGSRINSGTNRTTTGLGGDIQINLQGDLTLSDTSKVSAVVRGNAGGDILLNAHSVTLNNDSALEVQSISSKSAGNIIVNAKQLLLNEGGTLNSSTSLGGQGGNITVTAADISLTELALISSEATNTGNAGNIVIKTDKLSLDNSSEISAKSEGVGKTGSIVLAVKDFLELGNNSKITSSANITDGGPVDINSGTLVLDHSAIITSVEGLQGNGGSISVNTESLVMNGGFIQANTAAKDGRGGTVSVNAAVTIASQGLLLKGGLERQVFSPESRLNVIQAAAPKGLSGEVNVDTVELNLAGQLAKIDSNFALRHPIVNDPCRVARNEQASSLVQKGRGGLPAKASDSINLPLQRYLPKDTIDPQSKLSPVKENSTPLAVASRCKQERY